MERTDSLLDEKSSPELDDRRRVVAGGVGEGGRGNDKTETRKPLGHMCKDERAVREAVSNNHEAAELRAVGDHLGCGLSRWSGFHGMTFGRGFSSFPRYIERE